MKAAGGNASETSRSVRPMLRLVLARPRDRVALAAIACTAVIASAMEATLLVIITLAGFRLSGTGASPVSLPFGLPLDELATGKLLIAGGLLLGARLVVTYLNLHVTARLSNSILFRWRTRVVEAFLVASWQEQQNEQEGHLQTLTQTFVSNLSTVVQQLSSALTALASFLTFVVGAFALNPLAALGLLVFGGALSAFLRPLTVKLRQLAGRDKTAGQEYARQLGELGASATEIRIFGREGAFLERLQNRLRDQLSVRQRQIVIRGLTPQIFQAGGLGTVLIGLAVASRMELGDAVLIGALVLLMIRSLNYGQTFQSTYQAIAGSGPFVEGVLDALERYETSALPSGEAEPERIGELRLVGANIGYGDTPILSDVDLEIRPGEAVGLIGPSGAGKSTLGAVLLDLLRPLQGEYLASSGAVADIARDRWTSLVAFVPQEPRLFEGSVSANIDFHRDAASISVAQAANLAHLGRELDIWPEGLDREVGPRGGHLSGGQKQRVCIARALVGEPEVMVLDEPTSALDNDAEDSVTDVLRDLRGTRTLIVIAHRLTTLEFCDRVLLVDGGKVTEIGTGADVQNRDDVRRLAKRVLDGETDE